MLSPNAARSIILFFSIRLFLAAASKKLDSERRGGETHRVKNKTNQFFASQNPQLIIKESGIMTPNQFITNRSERLFGSFFSRISSGEGG